MPKRLIFAKCRHLLMIFSVSYILPRSTFAVFPVAFFVFVVVLGGGFVFLLCLFCGLGLGVLGLVVSNSNPNNIDYVIPANDDATKSVEVILGAICEAMNEGLQERKAEKIDAEAAEEAPKRERKAKAAVKKERTKKEDDEALNANIAGKYAKDEE